MLLKGKWVLAAIGFLLVCNLLFHLMFLLRERGNAGEIADLKRALEKGWQTQQVERNRLSEEIEGLKTGNRELERRLESLINELNRTRSRFPNDRRR